MWKSSLKNPVARADRRGCDSSSQRAVITNLPEAALNPRATYLDYAMRGESENRNKELKCDLCADRLSDHRFMAPSDSSTDASDKLSVDAAASNTGSPARLHDESDATRRRRHNARHQRNRPGEAHLRTWRMLVTKVAARIIVSARRVRILLSASWPNVPYLRRAAVAVANFVPH